MRKMKSPLTEIKKTMNERDFRAGADQVLIKEIYPGQRKESNFSMPQNNMAEDPTREFNPQWIF